MVVPIQPPPPRAWEPGKAPSKRRISAVSANANPRTGDDSIAQTGDDSIPTPTCARAHPAQSSQNGGNRRIFQEEKFTDPQPAAGPRKSPRSLQGRQTRSSGRRRGRGRVTAPMADRRRGVDRSPPGLPSTRQCWRARVRCTLWTKRKQERGNNTQTRSKRGREQYGIARGIARGTRCITVRVGWNWGTAAGTKPRPPKKGKHCALPNDRIATDCNGLQHGTAHIVLRSWTEAKKNAAPVDRAASSSAVTASVSLSSASSPGSTGEAATCWQSVCETPKSITNKSQINRLHGPKRKRGTDQHDVVDIIAQNRRYATV